MQRKKTNLVQIEIEGTLTEAKQCSKCEKLKVLEEFHKSKRGLGGRHAMCVSCYKDWYGQNKVVLLERGKHYYEKNKEHKIETGNLYRKNNKEKVKIWQTKAQRKYYVKNKAKRMDNLKAWKTLNPDMVKTNYLKWLNKNNNLPDLLNSDEYKLLKNSSCVLSGSKDIQIDHFIAVSTGHGGTYLGNLLPLNSSLNASKHKKNPFEWAQTHEYISKEAFSELVSGLAILNCLSTDEFKEFVYWCYENQRELEQILDDKRSSIEIWRESTGRPFPLPHYAARSERERL